MNRKLVLKMLGMVLSFEALFMTPAFVISLADQSYDRTAFFVSALICLAVGFPLSRIRPATNRMQARDGFATVAFCWVGMAALGALPFYISGAIPSYVDSFFEAASGFTTTGASLIVDVEILPRGLLFWRSFTHWIGGMGVLVLTLALLPTTGAGSVFLMRAESPGPIKSKLVPKIAQTAKILYIIYAVITLAEVILLCIAGMPLFDAIIHSFGTTGTGGFSIKNLSIGAYNSPAIEIIITIFMLLGGMNFSLHYLLFTKGDFRTVFKNEELRLYLGIVLAAITLITINILPHFNGSLKEALLRASFQTASIITTTGFSSCNFNLWPALSKSILVILMLIGACSGSTAGGIKNIRILLLFKAFRREIQHIIHPRLVSMIKVNEQAVEESTLSSVCIFFFAYIAVIVFAFLIISLDNFDFSTTLTSVLATIGNIGPGLELVGPVGNYAHFSPLSKLVLSSCMIIGRLEILPVLVLFVPSMWRTC